MDSVHHAGTAYSLSQCFKLKSAMPLAYRVWGMFSFSDTITPLIGALKKNFM